MNTTLDRLLDEQAELPPETADRLTSHLPMALHALHALGATPERLQAFHARYRSRLCEGLAAAAAPGEPVSDWHALRGTDGAYPALRATFAALLRRDGVDAVLRASLPHLLPGVAAAAFHGVIRTAHAVQAGHAGELACALAYWTWRWQPLAPPAAAEGSPLAFGDWSARLVEGALGWKHPARLISDRMAAAATSPLYQELAGRLAPAPGRLAELAAFAVAGYARTRNFTLLHAVTGLRALRVLSHWCGPLDASPVLVHALTAAYLAAQVPAHSMLPAPRLQTWPEVIAAACASDDDHVIKIVHACWEESHAYGPGRYLEAAALAVA